MELAGLEPAISWVRSKALGSKYAGLQGLSGLRTGADEPTFMRNLRDFTGVSARGGVRVAKTPTAVENGGPQGKRLPRFLASDNGDRLTGSPAPTTVRTGYGQPIWSHSPAQAEGVLSPAVLVRRAAHGLIATGFLAPIGYVWWCALTGRRGRLLQPAIAAVVGDGVLVVANRGDCPLGPLGDRIGDPVPLFELVLSPRAARRAVPALGALTVVGLGFLAARFRVERHAGGAAVSGLLGTDSRCSP
jgi:hypothetical protein